MSARYASGGVAVPDGVTRFDTVLITAIGLLPNTIYQLYVNGILANANVKPGYGEFGDDLVSSYTGEIVVEYYLSTTNWVDKVADLGLTATTSGSTIILNEPGYEIIGSYKSRDYMLFELVAPNSRAGAKLYYVPWTSFS